MQSVKSVNVPFNVFLSFRTTKPSIWGLIYSQICVLWCLDAWVVIVIYWFLLLASSSVKTNKTELEQNPANVGIKWLPEATFRNRHFLLFELEKFRTFAALHLHHSIHLIFLAFILIIMTSRVLFRWVAFYFKKLVE